jgi:DNA primase
MEGYTDVIMAHQNGLDNAVAVLGTALGDRHLQVLRRYTDSITLVLDGDEAGRRRTNEILDALLALFEKNEVDLRILTLPEGLDPCDFIATHGSDPFRALLAQAVDALEHKFKAVTNGLDTLTDTHRASQAAEQLLATLVQIRPATGGASSAALLREEQILGRIARQFHLPEERLRSRLSALRREARRRGNVPRGTNASVTLQSSSRRLADLPACDRDLLELVLLDPSYIGRLQSALEAAPILSPPARQIFDACRRLTEEDGGFDFGRLLAAFDDAELKSLLVQLDESSACKATADRERWLADLVDTHRRRRDESDRRRALAAAQQNTGDAEQLLAQFLEQSKTKHRAEYERRKK